MAVYGVAILSLSFFIGIFLGDVLGAVLQVKANVGGVGFAMLILILLTNKQGLLSKPSESGIAFWSAMYIPIIVAMAAQQNVLAAVKGGPLALLAGSAAVVVAFLFVPILCKMGNANQVTANTPPEPEKNDNNPSPARKEAA
jgi:malonate transporter MadL subunit